MKPRWCRLRAGQPLSHWVTAAFGARLVVVKAIGAADEPCHEGEQRDRLVRVTDRDIGNEGAPECQFAGSGRSFARTLPSAGGKPWRIHSGRARPSQNCGSRLWRRWRATKDRSHDTRRSGGGRREPHPRAQDQHKLRARLVVRMRRPPLRWLASLVRGVPVFESAMGDEQRRGRDVAMVARR